MSRVKSGVVTHARHRKIVKAAKGHYGARHRNFRTATQSVDRALQYATRDRKVRKRDFRALWIARINAACRMNGITYSHFMASLKKANIALNRKALAYLAMHDSKAFEAILKISNPLPG